MSLEGALEEERKLISEIMDRQKNDGDRGRGASRGDMSSSVSRVISRSVSRATSGGRGDLEEEFTITSHDPSERMVVTSKDQDEQQEDQEIEAALDTSEEELLSDTDDEFDYDDGDTILPNYNGPPHQQLHKTTATDELSVINNRKLLKEAQHAETLDAVLAAERALANAKSLGRDVPEEYVQEITMKAKEVGTRIHMDPERFYQNDKERREKLEDYAIYKKKLVSPAFKRHEEGFTIPYTSDVEEQMDLELARSLNDMIELSGIESDLEHQRTVRTITRGNFFEIIQKTAPNNPKTFILCMDFSDESKYALEWCIGTVLVDGSVLYVLNVIEDDEYSSMNLNGIQPKDAPKYDKKTDLPRDKQRKQNVETLSKDVLDLLKLTKLQVHVVIQSCHHPIPRHFIVEVIKHISPTMVMVGSKGSSAIKGVLLGSLSNHLVRKSSVPVMVVKNKLKKLTKKKQFSNNITPLHSLAEARID